MEPQPGADLGHPGGRSGFEACVFTAAPLLTVTAEQRPDRVDEVHLHAGGQGFWIARMMVALGHEAVVSTAAGGESGVVFQTMAERSGVTVEAAHIVRDTAVYVHDRRGGARKVIAETRYPPLNRHELDALYGQTLALSVESGLCVIAGAPDDAIVPPGTYTRLVGDLRREGVFTIGDVCGSTLRAVLGGGGVDVLKVSHEELIADGYAPDASAESIQQAIEQLRAAGLRRVVVSRAEAGLIACLEGRWFTARSPRLQTVDHRGAGDSLTAGLAAGVLRDLKDDQLLRLACAAGATTAIRHGLGTGERETIERLMPTVQISQGLDWAGQAETAADERRHHPLPDVRD